MSHKVLVCVDGSEPSKEATRYAVELARAAGLELIALRVVDVEAYTDKSDEKREVVKGALESHADIVLQEAADMAEEAGVPVERERRYGDSSTEIAACAHESNDVVLVVLGGSGRRKLLRRTLGSTAERVARHVAEDIPCPVMVTPSSGFLIDRRPSYAST